VNDRRKQSVDYDDFYGILEVREKIWMTEFILKNKCEVVSITRKQELVLHTYTLRGNPQKHVDAVKYMGVNVL